ncbi:MAG TPA: hypothetical protein VGK17_12500 [Propionicimonas sp.]
MTRYYVRIAYDVLDGEVTEHVGPFDAYMAELVCLSMAGGYSANGGWVHVKRAKVVRA